MEIYILLILSILIVCILFLICITRKPKEGMEIVPDPFHNILSDSDRYTGKPNKDIMMNLMSRFENYTEYLGLTYIPVFGTLLGCYRHGGFIPWDDDIDVAIFENDIKTIFENIEILEEFGLQISKHHGLNISKISLKNRPPIEIYNRKGEYHKWSWPYIDIFTLILDDDKVKLHDLGKVITCEYDDIFPLQTFNFEGAIPMFIPRNGKKLLDDKYPEWSTICSSYGFDHINDKLKDNYKQSKVPCETLTYLGTEK